MVEVSKDNPEPLTLSKRDVRCVLEESGVPDEKIQFFEKEFEEVVKPDTRFWYPISRRHANSALRLRSGHQGQSGADGPGRDTRH